MTFCIWLVAASTELSAHVELHLNPQQGLMAGLYRRTKEESSRAGWTNRNFTDETELSVKLKGWQRLLHLIIN
jgi:hypothetical protein